MNLSTSFKNRLENYKTTLGLKAFGLAKVPMLLYINPKVIELSDTRSEIVVPLNYFTRNHLHSMYFGTLCAAADCAAGLIAIKMINQAKKDHQKNISFVFKNFKADFLKRCEAETHFICKNNLLVKETIEKCIQTGEREEAEIEVLAMVPSKLQNEVAAKFVLTMSVKCK